MRPYGDITGDLEVLMFEMADHGMQMHEVIGHMWMWAMVHCPSMLETYMDGTTPLPYTSIAKTIQEELLEEE